MIHSNSGPKDALLLLTHGSHHPRAIAQNQLLLIEARRLLPQLTIELGFLDYAAPQPLDCLSQLADRGTKLVTIAPLLLLQGNHTTQDLPRIVRTAKQQFPTMEISVLPHLGAHSAVRNWSGKLLQLAVERTWSRCGPSQSWDWLFIARGGRAKGLLTQVSTFLDQPHPYPATPRKKTIELLTNDTWHQAIRTTDGTPLIVQTHLLLDGTLSDRIRAEINSATESNPRSLEFIPSVIAHESESEFCREVLLPYFIGAEVTAPVGE